MKFSSLSVASLAGLEVAVNHAMSLDDTRLDPLSALDEHSLGITINHWGIDFFIVVRNQKICFQSVFEGMPTVGIRGSAQALAQLITARDKTLAVLTSDIEVEGDIATLEHFQRLFAELKIDWEGELAKLTGGIAAHEIGEVARRIKHYSQNTFTHFTEDVREFLSEEASFITPRGKIDAYLNELDDIKLRMDRLDAHVTRLNTLVNKLTGQPKS